MLHAQSRDEVRRYVKKKAEAEDAKRLAIRSAVIAFTTASEEPLAFQSADVRRTSMTDLSGLASLKRIGSPGERTTQMAIIPVRTQDKQASSIEFLPHMLRP